MTDAGLLGVTLIGGFLGAGKTTLLSHLLRAPSARRVGVLVNDFGDLAVDAGIVAEIHGEVMRLGNGCICCSIQGDLMRALFAMKDGGEVDHVIIETSGVADAQVVAGELVELERSGTLRLDAVVTLVDAEVFPRLLREHETLAKAQVRAADLVIVNKADLGDPAPVEALVRALAPRARVVRAVEARIPLELLGVAAPDRDAHADLGAHNGGLHDHAHEQHDTMFSAWTFRESRPLTWARLGPLLASLPEGVFRAKGTVQLVERPGAQAQLQIVGARVHVRTLDGTPPESALVFVGTRVAELSEDLATRLRACVA